MFSYEEYYKLYNCRTGAEYRENCTRLEEMLKTMSLPKEKGFREKVFCFLRSQGEFLQRMILLEEKVTPEYYQTASMKELQEDQKWLYEDIMPEAYKTSYTNPVYSSSVFGKELGPVLAVTAAYFREGIADIRTHRRFMLGARLNFYFMLVSAMTKGQVRAQGIHSLLVRQRKETLPWSVGLWFHENYDAADENRLEIIETEELSQEYYLYSLGKSVSEEERKLHHFMTSLSEEEIRRMAEAYVKGYIDGFARDSKDIRRKSTVGIVYPLGMERMVRQAIELFRKEAGLEPFIQDIYVTPVNLQYDYDHRFDEILCMDEEAADRKIELTEKILRSNRSLTVEFGGRACIQTFGEEPFSPGTENRAWTVSSEQRQRYGKVNEKISALLYKEGGMEDSSYTMIAFPAPAVGESFPEIFRAMIDINTLDQERYGKVQQSLINALDRGTEVLIKGTQGNETALTVALQPIDNPKKQTNFYNCLADVNIPLGEVFTSPQLKGTTGLLHVEDIYLKGLRYRNLRLQFEDGYITDYSCDNFEDPEEGRRYIRENLLWPHDTLPMGEFAIGTNTLAYCMAKKYGIMDKLPILIIEKMGPHFAVGDTCYANDEERMIFNPDRKEICSRENEKTRRRKEDPSSAYTRRHLDITLPYESIGRISVIGNHGSTDIIREGRFVLLGTDILNEPMIRSEQEFREEEREPDYETAINSQN